MFFGRPYWNLGAVKRCAAKLPGFVERDFDRDLSVQADYEGDGLCTPVTLRGIFRTLPTLFAIPTIWRQQERFDRAFLAGGFDALLGKHEPLPAGIDAAFRELILPATEVLIGNHKTLTDFLLPDWDSDRPGVITLSTKHCAPGKIHRISLWCI